MKDTGYDAGWSNFIRSGKPEDYLRYKGIVSDAGNKIEVESKGEAGCESDGDRDRNGAFSSTFRGL